MIFNSRQFNATAVQGYGFQLYMFNTLSMKFPHANFYYIWGYYKFRATERLMVQQK
jgi:hypothetical protein